MSTLRSRRNGEVEAIGVAPVTAEEPSALLAVAVGLDHAHLLEPGTAGHLTVVAATPSRSLKSSQPAISASRSAPRCHPSATCPAEFG